ncbi:MAG: TIGR04438 family Trp-rich protein [Burkholderiaceae bacterium]|nr:TIGR04438 family Trp-rich protein [Burkholderiaceae bacterium]MDH3461495.1 TIGR04438 family Trp-rich protein [Burkholderiaceae bacterium]
MFFLVIGVLLLFLKVTEFGAVGAWSWWWVLLPFALAAAWWAWADSTGYTKKRAMDKIDAKREARRHKTMESLGMGDKRKRKR